VVWSHFVYASRPYLGKVVIGIRNVRKTTYRDPPNLACISCVLCISCVSCIPLVYYNHASSIIRSRISLSLLKPLETDGLEPLLCSFHLNEFLLNLREGHVILELTLKVREGDVVLVLILIHRAR